LLGARSTRERNETFAVCFREHGPREELEVDERFSIRLQKPNIFLRCALLSIHNAVRLPPDLFKELISTVDPLAPLGEALHAVHSADKRFCFSKTKVTNHLLLAHLAEQRSGRFFDLSLFDLSLLNFALHVRRHLFSAPCSQLGCGCELAMQSQRFLLELFVLIEFPLVCLFCEQLGPQSLNDAISRCAFCRACLQVLGDRGVDSCEILDLAKPLLDGELICDWSYKKRSVENKEFLK
jgi:hypothetical protein